MIIGINGRINSGKDTVGKIIQYLDYANKSKTFVDYTDEELAESIQLNETIWYPEETSWQIKKFADKLKERIALTWNIERNLLEDQEFKKQIIPELGITWRELMQLEGTKMREINDDYWANALMSEYKDIYQKDDGFIHEEYGDIKVTIVPNPILWKEYYPNWCITDMRFPNEMEAVKNRGGITIRVNRPIKIVQYNWDRKCPCCGKKEDFIGTPQENSSYWVYNYICNNCASTWDIFYGDKMGGQFDNVSNIVNKYNEHESETALDNAIFDYEINNNGTIEELIQKVKEILIKEKIINE